MPIPNYLEDLLQKKYGVNPALAAQLGGMPIPDNTTTAATMALLRKYGITPDQGTIQQMSASQAGVSAPPVRPVANVLAQPPVSTTPRVDSESAIIGNMGAMASPGAEGPSPAQIAAKGAIGGIEADLEKKRQRQLQGMADVAEGLGNIYVPTVGEIRRNRPRPEPYIADSIRAEMARADDELSESERAFFGKYLSSVSGQPVEIPKTMTRSRLEKFLPVAAREASLFNPVSLMRAQTAQQNAATQAANVGSMIPYREGMLEARNKGIEQTGERIDISRKGLDIRQEVANRPTPTATTKIEDLDTIAQNTLQLKADYQSDPQLQAQIGPLAGRWNKFLVGLGIADPQFTVFSANVENVVANNLYALSGKQINEAERADLRRTVFETMQNKESFEALLDNYLKRIQTKRDAILQVQEATGRDVEKLRAIVPGGTPAAAPTGGKVNAIWSDGSKTPIVDTPDNRAKAKQRGYTIEGE